MKRTHPRGRLALAVLAMLAFAIALVFPRDSRAAGHGPVEVRANVDAQTVGVGDNLRLVLQAGSPSSMPTAPDPGHHEGFSIVGSSATPTTSISIANGVRTDSTVLNVTWLLRADREGSFTVGPPSVLVDGKRYAATPVRVRVVAQGQAPPRSQSPFGIDPLAGSPFGSSPTDPWKAFFDDDPFKTMPHQQEVAIDPALTLPQSRGQIAFFHATVDKTRAVIGEQVTFAVMLYTDASSREPDFADLHEASMDNFVKRSLVDNDSDSRLLGYAKVDGRAWTVKLIRKAALFPLRAGDLEIGPMFGTLARVNGLATRESERIRVHVEEPPIDGRPPGYQIGDVGSFAIAADTSPLEVDRGGAVAVTVELTGTGNFPSKLAAPISRDAEWLEPEVTSKLTAQTGDKLGGKRTFAYVVRLLREGTVDLGAIRLPYYDPDRHAYDVAIAKLGSVHVSRGAAPAPSDEGPQQILPNMPSARTSLEGPPPARAHIAEQRGFWVLVLALPFAFVATRGAHSAATRLRARRAARAESAESDLEKRMEEAEKAADHDDARALTTVTARVIDAATRALLNVNVRGIVSEDVARALADAGVTKGLANDVQSLLTACEEARYRPAGVEIAEARERWARAKELVARLDEARG